MVRKGQIERLESKKIIEEDKWPSERLKKAVAEIGVRKRKFKFKIEDAKDVTKESVDLAKKYQPNVVLEGIELRSEKNNSYAGLLWRCVEDKSGLNRVLQYIYVWTKQKLSVSPYYMSLPTFLLGILGITLLTFINTLEYFYVQVISIALIGTGFMLVGLYKLITNIVKTRGLTLSYSYWFIAWGLIFDMLIFEIVYKNYQALQIAEEFSRSNQILEGQEIFIVESLLSKYITIDIGFLDLPFLHFPLIFIPITSLVLFVISAVCLVLSIWSPDLPMASHSMDYAPVYVYLSKRDKNSADYNLESVRYDRYHYYLDTIVFKGQMNENYLSSNKRKVNLVIDNSWHSLTPYRGSFLRYSITGLIISILSALAFFYSFSAPETSFFSVYRNSGAILAFIILPIVLFIGIFLVFAKHPTILADIDLAEKKSHLSNDKVIDLWNLKDEHAAFKIRRKLQAPFRQDADFWKDFRDHIDEIVYLDMLPRLERIERKLNELT